MGLLRALTAADYGRELTNVFTEFPEIKRSNCDSTLRSDKHGHFIHRTFESTSALVVHAVRDTNSAEVTMRIGFLSLPVPGHLNPMTALARKLQSRGHGVVFLSLADVAPFVEAAGLPFVPVSETAYPAGAAARLARANSVSCRVKKPCTLRSTR